MASPTDHKRAAIEQWTADPCGSDVVEGEPGSRSYFESLLAARHRYAPWMRDSLAYDGTDGLDVLDAGSGQGIDLYHYATAGARVTGIDLTPRHCELARQHLAAMNRVAEVVNGDIEQMPFADNSFDRISSNGVLHHTPDVPSALREIHRLLRPGGEARLIVYNRNSLHYWGDQVLIRGLLRGGLLRERSMEGVLSRGVEVSQVAARPLVRVYGPRQFRDELRAAGFAEATTSVRHFNLTDFFAAPGLARLLPALKGAHVRDRIGRVAGWYVVARGVRGA